MLRGQRQWEEHYESLPYEAHKSVRAGIKTLYKRGVEFARRLKDHGANLDGRVLDVGCGYFAFAVGLFEGGYSPKYTGIDCSAPRVDAAKAAFCDHPDYEFYHLDIKSGSYNPAGIIPPTRFILPCSSGTVDCAVANSFFTHAGVHANFLKQLK